MYLTPRTGAYVDALYSILVGACAVHAIPELGAHFLTRQIPGAVGKRAAFLAPSPHTYSSTWKTEVLPFTWRRVSVCAATRCVCGVDNVL